MRLPPRELLLLCCLLLCLRAPWAAGFLASPFDSCPRSLDCTLQRREFCPPGSRACGPCLPQFLEDGEGRCIPKTRTAGGRTAFPNLDEEIDLVADALSRQEDASQPRLRQNDTAAPTSLHSRVGVPKSGSRQNSPADVTPRSPSGGVESSPMESPRMSSNDALILGMIVVCTAAGIAALVVAAVCWCRLQKEIQLAQKVDYPAHSLPGPPSYDKISPGDKKLAQSAQMYHYQHQKQQMLSIEKHKEEAKVPESASSDEENEDGDFTVYECPGLAPTGEMEVRNPLFDDSSLHPPPPKLHP
ncbi:neural proliferation differentiation and control protein 1 isoform X2 [Sceloporus undulatus]|uniref:neural proliferation differentiation and control protein 1 isoform X2 n=1 Tax=Sceloporus undulatus TaxID=8520 RepID=UPI001C4AA383|nr:neural proliferation differentiation and control protein 1 isoform X2 [Sceloporus undulatus]